MIGLANDETGIPETPQQRLEIATKIVSAAGDHGIPPEDVVIDPLAMTVGADTEAVTTTLETIRLIREQEGCGILIVDHDLRLIMRLCEWIHVLAEGRTICEGTPDAVRRDPAVIREYIGTSAGAGADKGGER